MISIHPLCGIGEVEPGADLAALLAPLLQPQPRDILVVTQKIVSKAENRFVSLADVNPGAEARRLAAITGKDARLVELVLADSSAILRAAPNVLIARHRSGHVMANAGIDQSNLGARHSGMALLLPEDADRSAAALRLALAAWCHPVPAIIIADSFGRPWRLGVVNIAGLWKSRKSPPPMRSPRPQVWRWAKRQRASPPPWSAASGSQPANCRPAR